MDVIIDVFYGSSVQCNVM